MSAASGYILPPESNDEVKPPPRRKRTKKKKSTRKGDDVDEVNQMGEGGQGSYLAPVNLAYLEPDSIGAFDDDGSPHSDPSRKKSGEPSRQQRHARKEKRTRCRRTQQQKVVALHTAYVTPDPATAIVQPSGYITRGTAPASAIEKIGFSTYRVLCVVCVLLGEGEGRQRRIA
jgi:hypothetical protein